MRNVLVIVLLIVIGILGYDRIASNYELSMEKAISMSGNNYREFGRVLNEFGIENGLLKLNAAGFLIRNMQNKYYLEGDVVTEYHAFIDSAYRIPRDIYNENEIYKEFCAKSRFPNESLLVRRDLEVLKSDYLIENINSAFELWNKPWASHLSFNEFCEFILPYRVGNEMPENWRKVYSAAFTNVLTDSITTAREACIAVNNKLMLNLPHVLNTSPAPCNTKPSSLINMKFGTENDYANLALFAMRSLGIPVAVEFIPCFGNGNAGHTFNVLLDSDGKYYDFCAGKDNPGKHLSRFKGIPKIYRRTFGIQPNSLAVVHGDEPIPAMFTDSCITDVTGNYEFIGAKDISLYLDTEHPKKKFAYLCVFTSSGWSPVAWTHIRRNMVKFSNVGPGVIYQLAYYENGIVCPMGVPFSVDTDGVVKEFRPSGETTTLLLDRKFKPSADLFTLPSTIVGGRFQAANRADFRDATDIYTITEEPSFNFTWVQTNITKPFQYYRYLASESSMVDMAEIEFYDNKSGTILNGRVLGTDSIHASRGCSAYNVFDGDAFTYFQLQQPSGWVGLELDKPACVDKIRYIIRNDDNGIRRSNLYELLYMDNGKWVSAGKKTALRDDIITFRSVPSGAVYWLRNHTRGKNEHIFTYENGRQIWW